MYNSPQPWPDVWTHDVDHWPFNHLIRSLALRVLLVQWCWWYNVVAAKYLLTSRSSSLLLRRKYKIRYEDLSRCSRGEDVLPVPRREAFQKSTSGIFEISRTFSSASRKFSSIAFTICICYRCMDNNVDFNMSFILISH